MEKTREGGAGKEVSVPKQISLCAYPGLSPVGLTTNLNQPSVCPLVHLLRVPLDWKLHLSLSSSSSVKWDNNGTYLKMAVRELYEVTWLSAANQGKAHLNI